MLTPAKAYLNQAFGSAWRWAPPHADLHAAQIAGPETAADARLASSGKFRPVPVRSRAPHGGDRRSPIA